jgi:hypothetical protein
MISRLVTYSFVLGLAALLAGLHWAGRAPTAAAPVRQTVVATADVRARILLLQYCGSCHEGGRTSFDFAAASLEPAEMQRNHAAWELALRKLRDHKMPPRKSTQPSANERQAMLEWLEEAVATHANAGRWSARRLQRAEYLNVVRDLFGRDIQPMTNLPKDDVAWIACNDVPALPAEYVETYRAAAKQVVDTAFAMTKPASPSAADEDPGDSAAKAGGGSLLWLWERVGKTSTESARNVLAGFARRAYRVPVDAAELNRLVAVFEQASASGAAFKESLAAALQEVMISPRFLHRVDRPAQAAEALSLAPCDEFELATRLSFFLWSSVPDDELLDHAQAGTLRQNLESQVNRMLRDSRANALAAGFANYWLGLDKLDAAHPDDSLRRAMTTETRMFVAAIVREDRSVLEFLDADFTFVNAPLARHYGITGVAGDHFRRVGLHGTGRGGLMTQASILTLTTKTTETSPVIRGKWVLENLFGESISSPPPEAMNSAERPSQPGTILFQNSTCAQCHAKMDPIGYTLENFDPLGHWRSKKADIRIDPTGILPDGETLHGPDELKPYLVRNHSLFVRTLSEKLASYARGRRLSDSERQALAAIPSALAQHQFHFSRLILEVVQSVPFQAGRRDDAGAAAHGATP